MTTGLQLDTSQTGLKSRIKLRKQVKLFWGPSPLSYLRFLTVKSLCLLNPNWEIQLTRSTKGLKDRPWADMNRQDFECYKGKDYWEDLKFSNLEIIEISGDPLICPSHQSNFFKWETLGLENCVYSDMDILYVKPLDEIYDSMNSCDMMINHNGKYFSHGFMSSKGDNSFFKDLYKYLLSNFKPEVYQGASSRALYKFLKVKPIKSLIALNARYPNITVWNMPDKVVYPWTYNQIPSYLIDLNINLPEECIGLHWYAGSSLSQEVNNKITPKTIHELSNTVCYYGKRFS